MLPRTLHTLKLQSAIAVIAVIINCNCSLPREPWKHRLDCMAWNYKHFLTNKELVLGFLLLMKSLRNDWKLIHGSTGQARGYRSDLRYQIIGSVFALDRSAKKLVSTNCAMTIETETSHESWDYSTVSIICGLFLLFVVGFSPSDLFRVNLLKHLRLEKVEVGLYMLLDKCRREPAVSCVVEVRVGPDRQVQNLCRTNRLAHSFRIFSSPASKRIAFLLKESNALKEFVAKLEAAKDEYRIKCAETQDQLTNAIVEAEQLKRRVADLDRLRDELLEWKHTAATLSKYENEVKVYRKKMGKHCCS